MEAILGKDRIEFAILQRHGRPEIEKLRVHRRRELSEMDVGFPNAIGELPTPRHDRLDEHPGPREVASQVDKDRLHVANQGLHIATEPEVVRSDQQHDLVGLGRDDRVEPGEDILRRIATNPEVESV